MSTENDPTRPVPTGPADREQPTAPVPRATGDRGDDQTLVFDTFGGGDRPAEAGTAPLRRPVEIPISMSAGDMEVVVPDDVAVIGEIAVTAGQVTWDVDGRSSVAGFNGGRSETYTSDEAADGDVEMVVRITAGAGDVRVVEEN